MSENFTKNIFKKDKWLNSVTITLFAIGLICILYVLISNYMKKRNFTRSGNLSCVKESIIMGVADEFMAGIVEKGENVKVLNNFYNCNNIARGDLALYKFSEQIPAVVRAVRGVPGDKYTLQADPNKKQGWTISINDELLKVGDTPYYIFSNSVPPLKTYELSRGGILQADEYILLSNTSPGLSDSSNLGLIHKNEITAKVLLTK